MHQPMINNGIKRFSKVGLASIKKYVALRMYFKVLFVILKISAGVGLLILSIQGIQWGNLVRGMRSANLYILILAIISVMFGLGLQVWRWALFVNAYQIQASKSRIFIAYFTGQAANILLPLRGGEVIRAGYLYTEPKTIPAVASTIFLEKYLDILALTTCSLLVSIKLSFDNTSNIRGYLIPISAFLTILLTAAIIFGLAIIKRLKASKRLPNFLVDTLDLWAASSQWLKNPKKIYPGILLTIFIWGVMWLTNILLFKSLGLPLNGKAAGLVLVLVYIGLLPALMPGNIGPFYYFGRLALVPFGIHPDQAFLFAIVLHAIVTIPPLLGGAAGQMIHSMRMERR